MFSLLVEFQIKFLKFDGQMFYQVIKFIFGFLLSAGKLVHCEQISCSKNEYVITDAKGKQSCLLCNNCPSGYGLFPPCGSTLKHPHIIIDCFLCTGNTYSDEYGPSSCKVCAVCSTNEIVNKTCTAYENTACSKACIRGYYYDTYTYGCQPCSECCGNDEDIKVEECKRHNMPLLKQCSVHQSQRCRRRAVTSTHPPGTTSSSPSRTQFDTGTTASSSPSRTQFDTHNSINKTTLIACLSVIGTILVMVIIIILMLVKRGMIRGRIPCSNNGRHRRRGDDIDAEIARDDHCNMMQIMGFENVLDQGINGAIYVQSQPDEAREGQNHDNNGAMALQEQPMPFLDNTLACPEGQRWKLLNELDHENHERLEDMLAPDSPNGSVGKWYALGSEYGMEKYKLDQLKTNRNCKEASHSVLEFIGAAKPDLTVRDFSKTMEKIQQIEARNLLKDHMFKQEEDVRERRQDHTTPQGEAQYRK